MDSDRQAIRSSRAGRAGAAIRRIWRFTVGQLLWVATAVSGLGAVVSFQLATSMDLLLAEAVAEQRVFPYTGEAAEQAFYPGVVVLWSAVGMLVTLVVLALLHAVLRRWRLTPVTSVVASALIALLIDLPLLLLAAAVARDDVGRELYGWWYVPFLAVVAALHTTLMMAGTVRHFRPPSVMRKALIET